MKRIFLLLGCLLASALLLSAVGFWNGYPLFYSDTNAYLLSGMHLDTPRTRPMTYGVFILLTSFKSFSLWPVIVAQSAIVALLIYLVIHLTTGLRNAVFWTVCITMLLVLLTGVSWVSSELIADIFTPITLLSLACILSVPKLSRWMLWLLYSIFFFANATHISHVMISSAILLVVFLAGKRMPVPRKMLRTRLLVCLLLIGVGYVVMTSSVAKSRHVFLMARMNEIGVLDKYLDEQCYIKNYALCRYKDSIPVDFLWDREHSPVYRDDIGWIESQPEFDRILRDILTTPRYLSLVVKRTARDIVSQLLTFRVGNGNRRFGEDSNMYRSIEQYFPNETRQFLQSRQNAETLLPVPKLDLLHWIVVSISTMLMLLFLSLPKLRRRAGPVLTTISVLLIFGIALNAIVCVSIVTVVDRFGCRVIWLLPMLAMLWCILITTQNRSTAHS